MDNSINIYDLSNEEKQLLIDENKRIFNQLKDEYVSIKNYYINDLGGEPKITGLRLFPKGKLLIILKKLAKNVVISELTGISPIFLDHDLSALKEGNIEHYMTCDLPSLVFSVINDAIKGIDEVIKRLDSEEKSDEMLSVLTKFYSSRKDMEYGSGKRADYTAILVALLGIHSNIYSETKKEKYAALFKRGYNIGMKYDFLADIKAVFSKIDANEKSKGR